MVHWAPKSVLPCAHRPVKDHLRRWTSLVASFSTKANATTPQGIPYPQLTIGVPKETYERECRVAATPESVARLLKANFKGVLVQQDAGALSKFNNDAYAAAGAQIVTNVWKDADIILKVRSLKYDRCMLHFSSIPTDSLYSKIHLTNPSIVNSNSCDLPPWTKSAN
jgi:Alanine dehydrogenase/PNT, N-terminal domain